MKDKPIGIFDSGIGGLTVARAISKVLPNENLIYLGDTARVPYGTRGKEVITEFALELANFLLKQDLKFLVVACNTISATCLDKIQAISPVPVLGVITPAVNKIIDTTKNKKVCVIGTQATISTKAYETEIHSIDPNIEVFSKACPLFVPIAEEGLANSDIAELTAKEYLLNIKESGIDTLHLGCTHYPLLKDIVQKVVGTEINIIDAAQPTAEELKRILSEKELLNNTGSTNYQFYVTDSPERVYETAKLFFGADIRNKIQKIELHDL